MQKVWMLLNKLTLWFLTILVALKVGLSHSEKVGFIWFIGRPLKMMKNTFYLTLKALFVLKIFKSCRKTAL